MTRAELRKEWEARVDEYKASGLSVPAWCAAHDIKPHQLRYWVRKLESNKIASTSSPKWMTVEVDEQAKASEDSLFITVGEATVEVKPGFNQSLLADVVRTLTTLC